MVTFTACRSKPEMVVPARATPLEVKSLSDLDNLAMLRRYSTSVEFFRPVVPSRGPAPEQLASSLKAALAEALVYYYPMAGRLRELPGGKKLVVDCTAEGAVFIEAHANVRLEDFGKPLVPPYPCVEELMCHLGEFRAVIGKPLLYLQMTRLSCGGLVLALTTCHSVTDGYGMIQILGCIVDLARGQELPTVLPLWERHIFVSSSAVPPEPEDLAEDDAKKTTMTSPPPPLGVEILLRSFLFGPKEIAALRSVVPGISPTVFELITAVVWRCREAALEHEPHERVAVIFPSNARASWNRDRPLPEGFYGNANFNTTAEAAAGDLCSNPLAYAVGLVREAKLRLTDDYVRSFLDHIATRKYHMPLPLPLEKLFNVSDLTRCGEDALDLGWAERVGGGAPICGVLTAARASFLTSCKDANGEECVLVPMCLPKLAMQRFTSQIAAVTNVFAKSSM